MSEKASPSMVQRSPLDEAHRVEGAAMRTGDGWLIPARYVDPLDEYRIVRDGGCGLIDLCAGGRIEVAGSEAEPFLNGLVTNDVKALPKGAWMLAAFPNVQGRLVALVRILRLDQTLFLLDTEAATRDRVRQMLERYTLAGDFRVRDATEEMARLSLQGAKARETIAKVFGEEAARLERNRIASLDRNGPLLIRASHTGEDGFDIFIEARRAPEIWRAAKAAGARPIGFDALETLRIEAGIPRYGIDMDETTVVLETGLDEAVSFTKGCYLGQEIIARIRWRGHVAKKLMGLVFDERNEPSEEEREALPKAKIIAPDGKEMGRITSSARSPRLERTIALAYIRYAYLEPGTEAHIALNERQFKARVAALPMVRGSWDGAT